MMTHVVSVSDDWKQERGSPTYFLGDPVHVEASVILSDHMPLRIYVEHCVATLSPAADATLRYDFIEHHGWVLSVGPDGPACDAIAQYVYTSTLLGFTASLPVCITIF